MINAKQRRRESRGLRGTSGDTSRGQSFPEIERRERVSGSLVAIYEPKQRPGGSAGRLVRVDLLAEALDVPVESR